MGGIQERRDSGLEGPRLEGYRKGVIQDCRNTGKDGFRTGGLQERRASGLEGFKTGVIQDWRGSSIEEVSRKKPRQTVVIVLRGKIAAHMASFRLCSKVYKRRAGSNMRGDICILHFLL